MHLSIFFRWMGVAFYLATIAGVSGQTATSSQLVQQVSPSSSPEQSSQNQTTLQAFQTEQQALVQSLNALLTLNPTPQQLQTWQQQNATRFAAQQQRALTISTASFWQPMPYVTDVEIPENASQTLSDFLVARADLVNARVQIHNQLIQTAPASTMQSATLTPAAQAPSEQVQQTEGQLYLQQNKTALKAQQQRTQTLANELAQPLTPVPPPLSIPSDATPPMRAFMIAHDQMMRGQIQVANQYATADPQVKEAALEQWRRLNAAQIQQVQLLAKQLAQNLGQSNNND